MTPQALVFNMPHHAPSKEEVEASALLEIKTSTPNSFETIFLEKYEDIQKDSRSQVINDKHKEQLQQRNKKISSRIPVCLGLFGISCSSLPMGVFFDSGFVMWTWVGCCLVGILASLVKGSLWEEEKSRITKDLLLLDLLSDQQIEELQLLLHDMAKNHILDYQVKNMFLDIYEKVNNQKASQIFALETLDALKSLQKSYNLEKAQQDLKNSFLLKP